MKDRSVQVQSEISGGHRSLPTSGRKLTDPLHVELPSQAQTPSTQAPELSPSVPNGEITMVVSPYLTADPASPPDNVTVLLVTPRVSSAKSSPASRKCDPATRSWRIQKRFRPDFWRWICGKNSKLYLESFLLLDLEHPQLLSKIVWGDGHD